MSDKKREPGWFTVGVFGYGVLILWLSYVLYGSAKDATQTNPCKCNPTPTPAACCKADEYKQGFAQVDARFGGVWDELTHIHEDVVKDRAAREAAEKSLDDLRAAHNCLAASVTELENRCECPKCCTAPVKELPGECVCDKCKCSSCEPGKSCPGFEPRQPAKQPVAAPACAGRGGGGDETRLF